ncbi:MAG TPA: uroporphyrinogen-III C-methyltransferase [Rhodanobacteraceae bacterium]|nr:uroporphyrinogen-III C-methyltransferase [Rhodanobacteraceae bacterium]
MSDDPTPTETAAAEPLPPRALPPPRPQRRGAAAAMALLLALLAVAGVIVCGWYIWQLQRGGQQGDQSLAALQQRVAALDASMSRGNDERAALKQRLGDADAVNKGLREEMLGVSERTRQLEDAVANLSAKTLSGHDAMLLDETEMLLRMGQQRYQLFDDADGALQAYALADQDLAAVDDSAFASVRQSLGAERDALAATHPATRADELATLGRLRAALPGLPPKPLDTPPAAAAQGFWQRTWRALAGLVQVHRDSGAPLQLADARMARELAALDAAQAEAALLAHDDPAYRAALARVDAALAADFDGTADSVRAARADVRRLLAATPSANAAPKLGAALEELRNLRAVHAASAPASAGSAP